MFALYLCFTWIRAEFTTMSSYFASRDKDIALSKLGNHSKNMNFSDILIENRYCKNFLPES